MTNRKTPTHDELMNPILASLRALGGSGSIEEIHDKVVERLSLPEEMIAQVHDPEKSERTEISYRLAWARTYLKKYGLLENSSRGIWALTASGNAIENVSPRDVVNAVRALDRRLEAPKVPSDKDVRSHEVEEEEPPNEEWKQKLYRLLTQVLSAAAFERLVQRILRESGFIQVEVTGRTGDGGIDGKGIARIHGMMSFHVLFQCKRYKGSVGAGEIRDFRGAMVGRSDKGLFITTGSFTPAAVREATRDGAPAIDLIDGESLAQKLKELSLGVTTSMIEVVDIDSNWFEML